MACLRVHSKDKLHELVKKARKERWDLCFVSDLHNRKLSPEDEPPQKLRVLVEEFTLVSVAGWDVVVTRHG